MPTMMMMAAATTTASAAAAEGTTPADPKLMHLVKKMLNSLTTKPNADSIVTTLRQQHREYLRKDPTRLKAQVDVAMQQISSNKTTTTAPEGIKVKRKRKELDEDEYDQAAAANDSWRERVGAGGGLNACLRERYKKVQKERDNNNSKARREKVDYSPVNNGLEQGQTAREAESDDDPKSQARAQAFPSSTSNKRDEKEASTTQTTKPKLTRRRSSLKSRKSSGSLAGAGMIEEQQQVADFLSPVVPRPTERYSDLGGMEEVIQQIRQLVEYPLIRPELYRHLGVDPPRGVLLRGPPGTGKTHLANAVAGQLGVPYFRVSAPELVSGMSGESEERIRDLFKAASDMAPSIIFLDELDAIAPKRSEAGAGSRGMEKRMVAQLLTCMDMVSPQNNRQNAAVLVLAASNRPDSMDSALRRAGRFDKEILLGVPDEVARELILRTMTKDMRLSGDFDFKALARKTPGFVGADVRSLAKEAAVLAINRIFCDVLKDQKESEQHAVGSKSQDDTGDSNMDVAPLTADEMEPLYVTMDDFLNAVPLVQPSSKREGFATVPDVTWDDIGALKSIREELTISVLEPIQNPEKFQALGLSLPAGVLLYGPPGCGKTLLAKAIAHESGANFISVKGPELLDKYVGESERAVRLVFERARSSSPCIVFFDELDSLVPKRGSYGGSGGVSERVVNQLLTELDGLESRRSVFVIAATNRPELIDPAMMRPGRLDKLLYVPLPAADDRASILKALATNIVLADDVDMEAIGRSSRAEGYSGADCAALLREAGLSVLKEDAARHAAGKPESTPLMITSHHFDEAFASVMPSVSKKDQARYDRMRDRMARARSRSIMTEERAHSNESPTADKESG